MDLVKAIVLFICDLIMVIPIILLAFIARLARKRVDIGLGPEPMINNVHHKKALQKFGYSAETFVRNVYYISDDFDVRADLKFKSVLRLIISYYLFILTVFRYRCVYIYFSGGPLGFTSFMWRMEPWLYRIAKTRTVVMPYGGDIHNMSLCPNLLFKDAMSRDYPNHRKRRRIIENKVDLWTRGADHIISGCDWVYYMHHWDTIMLAHFSIDTELWKPDPVSNSAPGKTLRILHAPNHTSIKGSDYFIKAVDELKAEGLDLELVFVQRVPNDQIKELMAGVDIVADQLIIGWYAMFALEAMAMGKPVLCCIDPRLEEFYTALGLIQTGELPIIKCTIATLKDTLRLVVQDKNSLSEIGSRSREYVGQHHSLEAVGAVFDQINRSLRLK